MPLIKLRERHPEMTFPLVSSETFINLIERKADVAIRGNPDGLQACARNPLFASHRKSSPHHNTSLNTANLKSAEELKQHSCLVSPSRYH